MATNNSMDKKIVNTSDNLVLEGGDFDMTTKVTTKKVNIQALEDAYPAIKKAAWEAWRVFLPAFIAVILVQLEAGGKIEDLKSWLISLVSAAGLAGIKATLKYLRDTYGNQNYTSMLYKLPF